MRFSEAIPRVCRSARIKMSRWRNRQTPAVESRSFAGSKPALDTGRWWNLVTHLTQNEAPTAWEFESPPAHQFYSRGGIGRRGSLKTSVDMQVRLLPRVPHTRSDGDGSSLQNCDSGFNSSRMCLVAKPLLPGSSPGSHSIGGREATATLSGPENHRFGKDPDGGSTPPPSTTTLKFLILSGGSLTM